MRRILFTAASVAAVATAAGIAVVAGALALFHLLQEGLGPAGAYAVVAGAAALVAVGGALLSGFGQKHPKPQAEPSLGETVGRMVRERPIISAGAAIAAGLIALKNPGVAGAVLTSFLAGKSQRETGRRR